MPTSWIDAVIRQTRRVGDFPYPHWAAVLLNNPVRRLIGHPGRVVDALALTGDERVLEIGPGPAYFSSELARRLPRGRLDLFDVQTQMLDKARRRLVAVGAAGRVDFHAGDAGHGLPFPDASFDVAFLAAVLGEVPDRVACVRELQRVLRPGALAVFVEAFPDPDRLSVAALRELMEPRGFVLHSWEGSSWRDVVQFRRIQTR